jgi:hypothetical protein
LARRQTIAAAFRPSTSLSWEIDNSAVSLLFAPGVLLIVFLDGTCDAPFLSFFIAQLLTPRKSEVFSITSFAYSIGTRWMMILLLE